MLQQFAVTFFVVTFFPIGNEIYLLKTYIVLLLILHRTCHCFQDFSTLKMLQCG